MDDGKSLALMYNSICWYKIVEHIEGYQFHFYADKAVKISFVCILR